MFPIPKQYRLKQIDRSLNWYILWVNSRQYQTQSYAFLDDCQAWIPTLKNTSKFGDDCIEISEPLLPGYIFIGVKSENQLTSIEAAIHKASLCFYFLRDMHGRRYAMPYAELEKMVSAGDKHAVPNYNAGLRVGRKVRIVVGPYTGVIGKIMSMNSKAIKVEATCLKKNLLIVVHCTNYLVLEPI